jgi:hypothetical protein
MFEWHGYGRAYPVGRRPIVGAIVHSSDDERHRRLNDVVCVSVGEGGLGRMRGADLVADVAELVWEPVAESSSKPDGPSPGRMRSPMLW